MLKSKKSPSKQIGGASKKYLFAGVRLVFLLIVLIALPLTLLLWPIQKIECQLSANKPCPEILSKSLTKLRQKPLALTDFRKELTELPGLPSGFVLEKVSKKLPNTLTLVFLEESAGFQIKCDDCQEVLLIGDKRHTLQNRSGNNNLELKTFKISKEFDEIIENGELKKTYFDPIDKLIKIFSTSELDFQEGEWVSADEIHINLNNLPTAIFSAQDIENQFSALDLIIKKNALSQTGRDSSQFKEIDLRYNMPVLRTRK